MPPVPRTIAVLLAVAFVGAACSDADDADTRGGAADVSDAADDVRSRAEDALGVPTDRIELDGPEPIGESGCALYSAWDLDSTSPLAREYAVLSDGTVIDGLSDGAAGRTLDHCYFDAGREPPADVVARIAVRLAPTPGPVGLLDDVIGPRRLEPLGLEWQPPTATGSVDDGDFAVTYFARDLEIGTVLQATVTRSADGTIDIAYQQL